MRNFKRTLLAGAIALAVSAPAAAQFTECLFLRRQPDRRRIVQAGAAAGTGLFTTNPGPLWAYAVRQNLRLHRHAGESGRQRLRVWRRAGDADCPAIRRSPPTGAAVPIATQVTQFLAKGPARSERAVRDPGRRQRHLHAARRCSQAGTINQTQLQANVALAADAVRRSRSRRCNAARRAITSSCRTCPTSARRPSACRTARPVQLSSPQFAQLFNSTLFGGAQCGAASRRDPVQHVQPAATKSSPIPALYGFTNATTPACGTTPSLAVHAGNSRRAERRADLRLRRRRASDDGDAARSSRSAIESMITGPQQMAALGEAPLASSRRTSARSTAGCGRASTRRDRRTRSRRWAAYDYAQHRHERGSEQRQRRTSTRSSSAATCKLSDRLLVGVHVRLHREQGRLRRRRRRLQAAPADMGTIYAGYGEDRGTSARRSAPAASTTRRHAQDPARRADAHRERGDARLRVTGRLLGGYWFRSAATGCTVRTRACTYDEGVVQPVLGERVGQHGADLRPAGARAAPVEPRLAGRRQRRAASARSARVTWEYDSKDRRPQRRRASSVTLGGSFTLPAPKPDNSYALFNLGASTDFGGVTGYISGSATAAKSDGNYWAVTVGVRMPL